MAATLQKPRSWARIVQRVGRDVAVADKKFPTSIVSLARTFLTGQSLVTNTEPTVHAIILVPVLSTRLS